MNDKIIIRDSSLVGDLLVRVECRGTEEDKKEMDCSLGCDYCNECEHLIHLNRGVVIPMPEPYDYVGGNE